MSSEATMSATAPGNASDVGVTEFVVKSCEDGQAVLGAIGPKYEVRVQVDSPLSAGSRVAGRVKVKARKVWTIPAGGSFISPLLGEPRVVQGRVLYADNKTIVVQAGYRVTIELPTDKSAFDLKNGSLQRGVMVNVTIWPGAKFELA